MSKQSTGTAMAVYERVADPMAACEKMAKPVAALCGCSPEQGAAVMLACLCEGLTPMDFMRKYHVIQGRPSMRSDAMLAEFRKAGGKHEVLRRDPEGASVKLTIDGEEYTSTLTWEDAQKEDFTVSKPDKNGKRHVKDNYAYPRKRMQMLWARVISDGVRVLRPEIVAGVYTPEEMGDVIDGEYTVQETQPSPPKPSAAEVIKSMAASTPKQPDCVMEAAEDDDDFVEAEFSPAEAETDAPFDAADDAPLGDGYCTSAQSQKIVELFVELGVSEAKQQQILEKRNAQAIRNLTKEQAQEVIDRLEFAKQNGTKSAAEAKN